jgi:hypothetical protein
MRQVYKHGDGAYVILDQKPISHFAKKLDEEPNMEYVQMYMQWREADHVLRSNTHFLFCETINDAEYVEMDNHSDTECLDN